MICENIFTAPKGIQIALLVQSYGDFAERVDFFYWWSFSGEGSASAACAAGLFFSTNTKHMELIHNYFIALSCDAPESEQKL